MPTQSLHHNTPTFSTRNINANSPTSLPNPYNSPILASDLMAFPAGGIKNANTLDELRRALNQLAKDKKEYLDKLQVQVTNNDGDITIIDTNLTEIQADLVNVAKDLSRKAWESILIHAGTGLSGGGSIAQDRTINLNISSPSEIGGVKSATDVILETKVGESGINGHITVNTTTGYMKVLDNAVELGEKTRGDYIKNITATPADGITLTNGDGEGVTTDLKLTDIHSGQSEQLVTVTDANVTGHTMPSGKIRRVTLHVPTRDKYGRITSDSPLKINSANDKNLKVLVTDGLNITAGSNLGASTSKSATFKQNKGSNQDFTINHSPAVSALADTTFVNDCPTSGYSNYTGFSGKTAAINQPETLGAITFDSFGHVKQVTKRTLTYGLDSPTRSIGSNLRPYDAGLGSGYDLNVPTEADYNNLVGRVYALQGNRVLIPQDPLDKIQLERDTEVTGGNGSQGDLTVFGNLTVATDTLVTDLSNSRVGINKAVPTHSLDVVGNGKFTTDLTVGDDIFLGSAIHHSGDTDTKIVFDTDEISISAGNNLGININSAGDIGLHGAASTDYRLKVHGTSFLSAGANKSGLEFKPDSSSYTNTSGADTGITGYKLRAPYFLSSGSAYNAQFNLVEVYGEASGSDNLTHLRIGTNLANSSTRKPRITIGSLGADSPMVFIKEDGRVGIGTNDPQARLHVMAPTQGDANNPPSGSHPNSAQNSPSAIFDTTVECRGNLVVKGDFNLQNGITFDNWNLAETSGNVTAGGTQDFTNTTDSTSKTTGAVKIAGGLGVAKNITTNSLRATSGGNGSSTGGIILDVADGGSAPAMTAVMNLKGYEGRGAGILIQDSVNSASNPSNREWFIGSGYSQSVFNIGYAADGVQTSYSANTKFSVGTTGNVNAVGNITAQGNLTGVNGTLSGNADITGNTDIGGNLTVDGGTTLGNNDSDMTTISGDVIIGNNNSSERGKIFWDTSQSRLGIGETTPDPHFTAGTKVDIVSSDTGISELILRGTSQGSGRIFVGQSSLTGGGIQYNGDNNPAGMVGTQDNIVFYRRHYDTANAVSVDEPVFEYSQALDSGVKYNMDIVMANATDPGKRNITGVNSLVASQLTGTLQTAAQPNITSLGTLTSATITGDLRVSGDTFFVDHSANAVRINTTDSTAGSATGNTLTVGGTIAQLGADFRIFSSERSKISNDSPTIHPGRALVHNPGNELVLNYNNDFNGGTRIGTGIFIRNNRMLINSTDVATTLDGTNPPALTVGGAIQLRGEFGKFGGQHYNSNFINRKEYIQFHRIDSTVSAPTSGNDGARIYGESRHATATNYGNLVLELTDDAQHNSVHEDFLIRSAKSGADATNRMRVKHNGIYLLGVHANGPTNDGDYEDKTDDQYSYLMSLHKADKDGGSQAEQTVTIGSIRKDNLSVESYTAFTGNNEDRGSAQFIYNRRDDNDKTIKGVELGIATKGTPLTLNQLHADNGVGTAIEFKKRGATQATIHTFETSGDSDAQYPRNMKSALQISVGSGDGDTRIPLAIRHSGISVSKTPTVLSATLANRTGHNGTFDATAAEAVLSLRQDAGKGVSHIKFDQKNGTNYAKMYTANEKLIIEATGTAANTFNKRAVEIKGGEFNESIIRFGGGRRQDGVQEIVAFKEIGMQKGFTLKSGAYTADYKNSDVGHNDVIAIYDQNTKVNWLHGIGSLNSASDKFSVYTIRHGYGTRANNTIINPTNMAYTDIVGGTAGAFDFKNNGNVTRQLVDIHRGGNKFSSTYRYYTTYNSHSNYLDVNRGLGNPDAGNDTTPRNRVVDFEIVYKCPNQTHIEAAKFVGSAESKLIRYQIEIAEEINGAPGPYYMFKAFDSDNGYSGWPHVHSMMFTRLTLGTGTYQRNYDNTSVLKTEDEKTNFQYIRITRRSYMSNDSDLSGNISRGHQQRLDFIGLFGEYHRSHEHSGDRAELSSGIDVKTTTLGLKCYNDYGQIIGSGSVGETALLDDENETELSSATGKLFVEKKIITGGVMKGNIKTVDITDDSQKYIDLNDANTFVINVKADGAILSVNSEEDNPGAYYTFIIKNEGNHDINFGTNFFFAGGEPEITTGGSASEPAIDLMSFVCDGTNLYGGITPALTAAIGAS